MTDPDPGVLKHTDSDPNPQQCNFGIVFGSVDGMMGGWCLINCFVVDWLTNWLTMYDACI
jgi:hypothetical protein